MTVSFPGSDALTSPIAATQVPGFGALGLGQTANASSNGTTATQTQNPYQQSYDQIETWSSSYLLQSLQYGAPQVPQFTGGQSVDAFAQLNSLLAAIQPGVASGLYGGGTGTNVNVLA